MLKLIILIFFSTSIYAQSNKYLELSLEECIEIALENNLQLKRSIINERLQKVGYNQSILQQTPTLNVFSNYGNNYGRSIDPTTNTFISNNSNFSGVNASASLNLFSGFSVRNNIKRSKTLLEKSAFDLENTRNNVMLSVVSSYLNVLLSTDRLDNARFQLQSTQEQLSRTTKLVDAGSIAITNKLNLEAQVAGDELALIQQENNYRLTVLHDLDSTIFNLNIILDQDNTVEDFTARYDAEILSGKNNKFEFGFELTKSDVDYLFVRDDTLTILNTKQNSDLYSGYFSYDLNSV